MMSLRSGSAGIMVATSGHPTDPGPIHQEVC